MKITEFKHLCNISIDFGVDCALVGVTTSGHIYVESYADDGERQYHISPNGEIITSGEVAIPDHIITPQTPSDHPLNHRGLRQRGLRESERIADWVLPLTIIEKMPLMPLLGLAIPPMLLLGIAESYVLSEAKISDTLSFICRRVRFAYAMPQPQIDADGLPYDYDTLEKYIAHLYDASSAEPVPLAEAFQPIDNINLKRPMDCIVLDNKLILADSSSDDSGNRIVLFELTKSH